jgi:hypothetical protein
MPIIRLDKLLKSPSAGRLDKIIQRAQDMQELTTELRKQLDPDLAPALLSANVRHDELVLVAASSAWAARLRYESEGLLAAAKAAGHPASRCQVKVARP